MPFPIFWPIGTTLVLAFLAELATPPPPQRYQKSIEVCTATCQATWIKEDGVVRVYSEQSQMTCAQIVVEVQPGHSLPNFPAQVEGHPVVVRMGDLYGRREEGPGGAATDLVRWFRRWGRALQPTARGDAIDFVPASGAFEIIALHRPQTVLQAGGGAVSAAGPLSEQDEGYIAHLAERHGALYSVRDEDGKTRISFHPKRHGR